MWWILILSYLYAFLDTKIYEVWISYAITELDSPRTHMRDHKVAIRGALAELNDIFTYLNQIRADERMIILSPYERNDPSYHVMPIQAGGEICFQLPFTGPLMHLGMNI